MELYKYMPYRDGFFEKLLFSFTGLDKFNDPFEGQFQLTTLFDALSGKYPKAHESLKKKKKVHPHPDLGVLSLSKSKHSLLMWAHYAHNHEGIIVGFDTSHPFFNQKVKPIKSPHEDTSFLGKVFPVTYDRVRPEFKIGLNYTEALLSKSDEWMYEKEYRMFLRKSDCCEFGKDKDGNTLDYVSLFKIPASAITRVILGERSNKPKIIEGFKKATSSNDELLSIEIEVAELHEDLYHIEHKKLNITT